ncbi:hypothetical protein AB2M62_19765 [Sphingomonas sp. MMS12-HWE2-04]|uniref:hypothetical protein n=1 Tax=Sphingomonas sp. MMS12-HWE2-04 TaxID=3234199 RepID=UPI00384AF8F8
MLALLSWTLMTLVQASPTVEVQLDWDGSNCTATVDGAGVPVASLEARGRQWAAGKRSVHVSFVQRTPYRCIGSAIYLLQMAENREMRVDYPHGALAIELFVPAGRCRILADGVPQSIGAFRRLTERWRDTQPEIHFKPDLKARYSCVKRVLKILKSAHLSKLGFVGYESAP